MLLIHNLHDLKKYSAVLTGSIVTVGNYDGIHLGHQRILHKMLAKTKRLHLPTVAVIFEPQPEEYFNPQNAPARLMGFQEKIIDFRKNGIDAVVCLRFNKKFSLLSPHDFIQQILCSALHVKYLVIGEDFNFGQGKKGNADLLKQLGLEFGFQVEVMNDFKVDNIRVSSTAIRGALARSDLATAERFLGRPYSVTGRVVHGNKLGRDLGFPTANVALHCKTLPLSGVYVVKVCGLEKHPIDGIANIGFRPTIEDFCTVPSKSLEVYLFDFSKDIYRRKITVEFLYKLRDEKKFANFDLLVKQIKTDIMEAKKLLK